jgi:predicted DCC family thiol-disulfide oxidoreductase YuxK
VIKRDPAQRFRFVSIQSAVGQRLLRQASLQSGNPDTFVMIRNGRYYTKSGAALRVLLRLRGLWPLLYVFIAVPVSVRDRVYNYIASRRYRWFGRNEACLIPTPELRKRFWDDNEEAAYDAKQTDLCGNRD